MLKKSRQGAKFLELKKLYWRNSVEISENFAETSRTFCNICEIMNKFSKI